MSLFGQQLFGYVLTISQLMWSVYRIRNYCFFPCEMLPGLISTVHKRLFSWSFIMLEFISKIEIDHTRFTICPQYISSVCIWTFLFDFQISMNDQSMCLRYILGVLQLSSVTIAYGNFLFNVQLILLKLYSIHSKWWTSFFFSFSLNCFN